jgi:hypothetical protein
MPQFVSNTPAGFLRAFSIFLYSGDSFNFLRFSVNIEEYISNSVGRRICPSDVSVASIDSKLAAFTKRRG